MLLFFKTQVPANGCANQVNFYHNQANVLNHQFEQFSMVSGRIVEEEKKSTLFFLEFFPLVLVFFTLLLLSSSACFGVIVSYLELIFCVQMDTGSEQTLQQGHGNYQTSHYVQQVVTVLFSSEFPCSNLHLAFFYMFTFAKSWKAFVFVWIFRAFYFSRIFPSFWLRVFVTGLFIYIVTGSEKQGRIQGHKGSINNFLVLSVAPPTPSHIAIRDCRPTYRVWTYPWTRTTVKRRPPNSCLAGPTWTSKLRRRRRRRHRAFPTSSFKVCIIYNAL